MRDRTKNQRLRQPVQITIREKRCFRCGQMKWASEFSMDNSTAHGLSTYCQDCDRERSKEYYAAHRERILATAAEKRGPQPVRHCSECGDELEGRRRVVCSSTCRERRWRRLHPEAAAEKQRRKRARRREREASS